MRRRTLLTAAAAGLALPRYAKAATVLRFIPQADLAVLDPIQTTAVVTMQHACLVFDTLYGVDAGGVARPQMVAGHTVSADGLDWQITLRDGLQFHDGTPVLARDVVASVRRWGSRDSFGLSLMAATDELSAPSDTVVRFRLKRPFPMLPDALGKVGVNTAVIMPERLAKTSAMTQVTEMVGSGPFRFVAGERVPGSLAVYEKFAGYVPRGDGAASLLAGPKVARVDRVEWHTIPDASTAAAALASGEMDWWEAASADLVPGLRRRDDVTVRVQGFPGYAASLRPNELHPPFDNPGVRRAIMGGILQSDFMTAAAGEDRTLWRDRVGFFHPDSPMASDVGMEALTGPRDLDAVRRGLEAAGYKGERCVLLAGTDRPVINAMAEVANDLLRRVGMNVDFQATDWGTVLQRSGSKAPVEQGGWSLYVTGYHGASIVSPAPHNWLRGNGGASVAGWPTSARIEALRDAWFAAPDLAAQQAVARDLQVQAFADVPYYPLGLIHDVTAFRKSLTGVLPGLMLFYNVAKA
jgi:peptide/nickel transport system substrate-binding protein